MILPLWFETDARLSDSRTESQVWRDQWVLNVLASHLGISEDSLRIQRAEGQKPVILRGDQLFGDFSLSHSGEQVVLTWSDRLRVGVDLERIRPLTSAERLVERYFSPVEREDYDRATGDRKQILALEGWVRREALFKALGTGVRGMGESVCFEPSQKGSAWVARVDEREFTVEPIPCPTGFLGAIAYSSREDAELKVFPSSRLD